MKITLIQSRLEWQNADANLKHLGSIVAKQKQADLIVLPEMFSTGFTMNPEKFAEEHPGQTLTWMKHLSSITGADIAGSVAVKDGGQYFNRLYYVRSGAESHVYDKRHLFRMGEEDRHYSAGTSRLIIPCGDVKICPLVCYDLRFPVWSRNRFDMKTLQYEYDLLIYVANWPAVRSHAWKSLLVARAIENQCYVAGVNRVGIDGNGVEHTGDSMVVDFKGEIITSLKPREEGVVTAQVDIDALNAFRNKFPAGLDADEFNIRV